MGRLCVKISRELVEACAALASGQRRQFAGDNVALEIAQEGAWTQFVVTKGGETLVEHDGNENYQIRLPLYSNADSEFAKPKVSVREASTQENVLVTVLPIGEDTDLEENNEVAGNSSQTRSPQQMSSTPVTSTLLSKHGESSEATSDSEAEVCESTPIPPTEEKIVRKRGRPRKNESKQETNSKTKNTERKNKQKSLVMKFSLPTRDCEICDASFTNAAHVRAHMTTFHSEYSEYVEFSKAYEPIEHDDFVPNCSSTDDDSPVKNSLIVKNGFSSFRRARAFKKRTLKPATSGETFKCEKCGRNFKELEYLRHHVKRKHENELEMLTVIETKRALVRKKKLLARKGDLVACPVCGLGFQKHAKGILAHMTKVHPKYESDSFLADLSNQPAYVPKKMEDLSVNGSTNAVLDTPMEHASDSDLMSQYTCELCDKQFLDTIIVFHIEKAHSDAPERAELVLKYRSCLEEKVKLTAERESRDQVPQDCMFCGKKCKKIVQHMRRCRLNPDSVQTKQCACGFRVKTQEALAVHKESCKLNSCTFLCDLCGLEFSSKSNMYYHRRSKHGICGKNRKLTVCPCPICGKVFPAPSRLSKHMTVHTGLREYICETCGKDFKISEHLRHHVVTKHLGRYRYHCDKCGHGINKRQKLKTHKCDRVRRLQGPDVGEFALKKQLLKEQREQQAAVQRLQQDAQRQQLAAQRQQLAAAKAQVVQHVIETNQLPIQQTQQMLVQPISTQIQTVKAEAFQPEIPAVGSVVFNQDVVNIKPEVQTSIYQQVIPQHTDPSQSVESPVPINIKRQTSQTYYTPDLTVTSQQLSLLGQNNPLSLIHPLVSMANTITLPHNQAFDYLNSLPSVMFDMQQMQPYRVTGTADGNLYNLQPVTPENP